MFSLYIYLYDPTPLLRTPGISNHMFIFCSCQVEVAAPQVAASMFNLYLYAPTTLLCMHRL